MSDWEDTTLTGGRTPTTRPVDQTPAAPDPIDADIQSLTELIRGEGGTYSRFMDAADRLHQIATGAGDPAFKFEEDRALAASQDQFRRRGLGFSAAAVNAGGRVRQQFGGLRLQRQDAATQAELDALTAGTETYALPTELMIGQNIAEKSGQGGGGDGILGTVICTEIYRRGDLPALIYEADTAYGREHVRPDTLRGYHLWAKPLVRWAQHNERVYCAMRFLGRHWAYHMAYLMGTHGRPDRIGALLLATVKPCCTFLGALSRHVRRLRRRWALYGYSEV